MCGGTLLLLNCMSLLINEFLHVSSFFKHILNDGGIIRGTLVVTLHVHVQAGVCVIGACVHIYAGMYM